MFIVTIRLKAYRTGGVKGDWFQHWGAAPWVKILGEVLPDARSRQRTASLETPRVTVRESKHHRESC